MSEILGFDTGLTMPGINLTGIISSTWLWVLAAVIVGIILIAVVIVVLYLMTFNRKIVFFENIAGQGYQPIMKTRARIVKLGIGGEELLKTLKGGRYLTAYGRKMGRNTYWFARGQDGYLYNILLGDLDAKMGMLDIEPIDRDVRMFHVALDRLSHQTYGKSSFLEKYGIHMMLFLFLIVLVLGMWFLIGKMGDVTAPLAQNQEQTLKVQEANERLVAKLDSLLRGINKLPESGSSGLVPAT
jgi:cell division protein FtsB